MRYSAPAMLLCCICVSACNTTGLDAQKSFSCKAPPGISCSSVSGVYANAVANNLPGANTGKPATVYGKTGLAKERVVGEAPTTGTPLLSEPTVLRVWIAPWEDEGKVLHDQSFLYAVVDPGHWQVAHSKQNITNQYRVLAPTLIKPQQQVDQPAGQQFQAQPPVPAQQPQSVN